MAYPQETFTRTSLIPGSLIWQRRETAARKTLLYQLQVLKDTGRYDAFKLQWHPSYADAPDVWPIPNHLFWDSDVGKWIEGACYFLHDHPNQEISSAVHELTQMIISAQQPDGYLNIHFTVVEPGKRFTNIRDFHELYNAGHLIEAALAHHRLYQNNDLLEPLLKYVELLCRTFGPKEGQIPGYPGHPEIELALLRLWQRTRDPKHLELAKYFITERGRLGANGEHYYRVEAKARGEGPHARMPYWGGGDPLCYYQAHKPITEQKTIEGHSVRAMYLLTAVSDLVGMEPATTACLKEAVYRLWHNMVGCKMYVTGGIGAIKQWEGFGPDYFLPQGTDEGGCYAETCAAIGVMMLADRILQYDLDRQFSDVMELCLYNAVLTAMSHDGTKFTYVNQLASSEPNPSTREEWFTCACCPPNVLRLLGQVGGYIYSRAEGQEQVNVHLYIPSEHRFQSGDDHPVTLVQKSDWPWKGQVEFELKTESSRVSVALRIPGWARSWKISPSPPTTDLEKGYLILPADWVAANPRFTLTVDMSPRLVAPHPYTNQDIVALIRGPIVYCVEDVDNAWVKDHFKSVQLDPACSVGEKVVSDATTGDQYVALTVAKDASIVRRDLIHAEPGVDVDLLDGAVRAGGSVIDELNFIPYYFRASRGGSGQMRVGLKRWHR
ncbi:hypothetical protein G647_00555 [Cladophialophora carrionii CBS 160.54]|uniref:DUF1680 domain protein n=1 Tax=Cladophialophora carrionii CBS 160.54 TaxID=1279043 RepID=V9DN69_9EURO|nr:uncharacterized protein G647_00555 [Cladophialophora carrionii CBS 160.54]ETI28106.1 hypothetical protein G647_00555 [Cladophialophora carrionii CBS 160.54]